LVIVDSTGLKVYGKGEWHQEKHGVPARRTWRKLHLAVDENHQILACELTTPEVGDPTAVPDLLAQIDTPFDTFMGDGAYDGEPVSQAVLTKQPDAQVVVPPHKTAVYSAAGNTQRDEHIRAIEEHGRMGWQKKTEFGMSSQTATTSHPAIIDGNLTTGNDRISTFNRSCGRRKSKSLHCLKNFDTR
jgi:hypothetical protein